MKEKTSENAWRSFFSRLWNAVRVRAVSFIDLLNRGVDNMNLRRKMVVITVFCVLIPVLLTDVIFWRFVNGAEKTRAELQMNEVVKSVESGLDIISDNAASVTASVYTNSRAYELLDKRYRDITEYVDITQELQNALRVVYGATTAVSGVSVYVDNNTILNGGSVYQMSSAWGSDWYARYRESGAKIALCPYYDESQRNAARRRISVVRKLDYKNQRRDRLVKVDLNYSYCQKLLTPRSYEADVCICDGDTVIFSNAGATNFNTPFRTMEELGLDPERAVISSRYDMFGKELRIYCFDRTRHSIFSANGVLRRNWALFAALILLNLLLPFTAIRLVSRSLEVRLTALSEHMDMVKDEDFQRIEMPAASDELGRVIENYNLMAAKIGDLIQVVYKEEQNRLEADIQKKNAELQALHSQINPHFIFNALESIRMRSLIKHENETAEAIEFLALMMRKSTDWYDDMVSVADEAAFAEAYLRLQQYRFGERLSYRISVAPGCEKLMIPKLTLVTFIENACVHGVEKVSRPCIILMTVERGEEELRIYIEDTGAGIDEEQRLRLLQEMHDVDFELLRQSKSVGILNACLRLKNCFGSRVRFELDSEEGADTCFTIIIPLDDGGCRFER